MWVDLLSLLYLPFHCVWNIYVRANDGRTEGQSPNCKALVTWVDFSPIFYFNMHLCVCKSLSPAAHMSLAIYRSVSSCLPYPTLWLCTHRCCRNTLPEGIQLVWVSGSLLIVGLDRLVGGWVWSMGDLQCLLPPHSRPQYCHQINRHQYAATLLFLSFY